MFTSSLKFRIMAIVAYASVNVAEHPVRTRVKQSTDLFTSSLVSGRGDRAYALLTSRVAAGLRAALGRLGAVRYLGGSDVR